MVLVPEFFTMMGIVIFLATSFVCLLLGDHLPRFLPYAFQGAAATGLGALLLVGQRIVTSAPINPDSISLTSIWIGIPYLASAVSSLVGMNLYLATTRRAAAQTSNLARFVTAPTLLISAILLFAYLGTNGQVELPPATIMI